MRLRRRGPHGGSSLGGRGLASARNLRGRLVVPRICKALASATQLQWASVAFAATLQGTRDDQHGRIPRSGKLASATNLQARRGGNPGLTRLPYKGAAAV